MMPNEEIIGTLLVSLLVFGTQNRAKWLSAEELTHRAIESSILATDPTLIHYRKVLQSMSAYYGSQRGGAMAQRADYTTGC
jgi:hypothetical protein